LCPLPLALGSLHVLPFWSQQAVEQGILNLSANLPTLTQESFAFETESLKSSNRRRIARIDISLNPVQLQLLESIFNQQTQRFLDVPFPPESPGQCVSDFS